ncbi:MAG: hypothetical protein HRT53_09940 [Colwellia sp.]|nr:hypothetical protein [Colwellia sp.]
MTNKTYSDTNFTVQVKSLLSRTYGRSQLQDSVLERAIEYYEKQPLIEHKLAELKVNIEKISAQTLTDKAKQHIIRLEREQRSFQEELRFDRHERYQYLFKLSHEIINLCEGDTFAESNRKSAQVLGTIQLLSPTEGNKVALMNEEHKPLYKSVLCLRLLDRLCIDKEIVEPYIKLALAEVNPEKFQTFGIDNPNAYKKFVDQVKIPLVMAALIQDIGNNHAESLVILHGKAGREDPNRTLPVQDRKRLLQVNYRETVKYLVDGIGAGMYIGNSKADRDKFNVVEHKKLLFIKHLLKSSVSPKEGIGNLLKVPQIYSSIILSTKASYNYKLLPKVFQALNQNAERGACSQVVVDALAKITGQFPQGFGVTYIPYDQDIDDRYEYAVVCQLYPKNLEQPICRMTTRNLAFMGHGQEIEIKKCCNLYFVETAKNFSTISKDRLHEILELLASNYHERKQLDLVPRCWQPTEFFTLKAHQKLWNKAN